jgi:hypothetical protein
MQNIWGRFQSIWADKLALVLFAIILLGVAFSWGLVVAAAGVEGANHVLASTGLSWVENGMIGIALLWIVLRAIDFLRGGPTHAMFAVQEKEEAKRTLAVGNDLAHHC